MYRLETSHSPCEMRIDNDDDDDDDDADAGGDAGYLCPCLLYTSDAADE